MLVIYSFWLELMITIVVDGGNFDVAMPTVDNCVKDGMRGIFVMSHFMKFPGQETEMYAEHTMKSWAVYHEVLDSWEACRDEQFYESVKDNLMVDETSQHTKQQC